MMPIDAASGTAPVPAGTGPQRSAQLRRLATVIQQASKAPAAPRFTKGYVAAVDGLVPTQTVSVYIDGDTSTLISGVTFADSYQAPMVGDSVIVVRQGADTLILGRYNLGGNLLAHALLGVASTIALNIPASAFNHLRVYLIGTAIANAGSGFDDLAVQFNGDSAADYSKHFGYTLNGGAWNTANANATTFITAGFLPNASSVGTQVGQAVFDVALFQRASLSKSLTFNSHASSGVGAPNNDQVGTGGGIWGNGSAAITSISIKTATSPGTLGVGSEVFVYGV